jgi:hypothetical protein
MPPLALFISAPTLEYLSSHLALSSILLLYSQHYLLPLSSLIIYRFALQVESESATLHPPTQVWGACTASVGLGAGSATRLFPADLAGAGAGMESNAESDRVGTESGGRVRGGGVWRCGLPRKFFSGSYVKPLPLYFLILCS